MTFTRRSTCTGGGERPNSNLSCSASASSSPTGARPLTSDILFRRAQADDDPSHPAVMPRGSGGGGRSWEMNWWVWPLPPPGPLALVCEWQAHGIALRRHELDAAPLLEAAARVEPLWPNGGAIGGSASSVHIAASAPRRDPPRPSSS
jgi:hypothetical protein